MEVTYIYALIDPRTDEVRYVGKADAPEMRRKQRSYIYKELVTTRGDRVAQEERKQQCRMDVLEIFAAMRQPESQALDEPQPFPMLPSMTIEAEPCPYPAQSSQVSPSR
jgi:hypothetical protein